MMELRGHGKRCGKKYFFLAALLLLACLFLINSAPAFDSGWVAPFNYTGVCGGKYAPCWSEGYYGTDWRQKIVGVNLNYEYLVQAVEGVNLFGGAGVGKRINVPAPAYYYVSVWAAWDGETNEKLSVGTNTWGEDVQAQKAYDFSAETKCVFRNKFGVNSMPAKVWAEAASDSQSVHIKYLRVSDTIPYAARYYCDDGVSCTRDCRWTEWSEWGACSAECDGGIQNRTRERIPAQCGGLACSGNNTEFQVCNTDSCCDPANGVCSAWSDWSICDLATETQTRTRTYIPPSCGGEETECSPLTETRHCASIPDNNQSYLLSSSNITVYLDLKVDYYDAASGSWLDDANVISGYQANLSSGIKFRLAPVWNSVANGFFTSSKAHDFGVYRARADVFDELGYFLTTATYNFTISPLVSGVGVIGGIPGAVGNTTQTNLSINFTTSNYPLQILFNLYDSNNISVDSQGPTQVNSDQDIPVVYSVNPGLAAGTYSLYMTVTDVFGHVDVFLIGWINIVMGCSDSDNGRNYYAVGTTTDRIISSTDFCVVAGGTFSIVNEYFCDGLDALDELYACPYGCAIDAGGAALGRCAGDGTSIICTDSDNGADYYVFGNVTANGFSRSDFCTGSLLIEWECAPAGFNYSAFNCLDGCANGACLAIAPQVNIISPLAGNNNQANGITYTVSDNTGLASCWYSLNSGALIPIICGENVTGLTASAGQNNWTISVRDLAGNQNSSTVTFYSDTDAPAINFVEPTPADGAIILTEELEINASASDANLANITIRIFSAGGSQISEQSSESSQFYISYNLPSIGAYAFEATACDSFGSCVSTPRRTIYYDSLEVGSCRNLSIENGVYTLQNDVTGTEGCIVISANNITLNGNGFRVGGGDAAGSCGILIENSDGVLVRELTVSNFESGICFVSASNSTAQDVRATANKNGARLEQNSGSNLLHNLNADANMDYSILDDATGRNYLVFENADGQIMFTSDEFVQNMTLADELSFPGSIKIGFNSSFMDNAALPELANSEALITLRGLDNSGKINLRINRDGIACDAGTTPACTAVTALDLATVIFEVSGWSEYSLYGELPPTLFCGDGSCTAGESCSTCSSDCGACSSTGDGGGGGGGYTAGKTPCIDLWRCTSWTSCDYNLQTRTCNNEFIECRRLPKSKPNEKQTCISGNQELSQISESLINETPEKTAWYKTRIFWYSLIGVVALGLAGAAWYFFVYKKKKEKMPGKLNSDKPR